MSNDWSHRHQTPLKCRFSEAIDFDRSRFKIIHTHMVWDGDKIRDLRLRMGWSRSDLARRLQIESQKISDIEMELLETPKDIWSALDLLLKQADVTAISVSCDSLAEILFDEDNVLQVDRSSIQRKFLDQ